MLSIKISTAALKASKQKLVENANRRYRRIVYDAFEAMLDVSYQYSGNYTMNWHIVTNQQGHPSYVEYGVKDSVNYQQPHAAGDLPAIDFARQGAVRAPFNYKDKVYFVNPSPLEFTQDSVTGPDGETMKLRPENIIGSGILLKSFVQAYMRDKYGAKK